MEYRHLGRTGLLVSDICLGTMQFRWTTDDANANAVLDAFFDAGGNFIDTADVYSRWAPGLKGGEAETVIGEWMQRRGNRQDVVLATKVRGRMWDGPNGEGLSRAHILRAVDESLRRLQTDYIDLYQTHAPDLGTPIEETLRALDDLIHQGKVRYAGCSNYTGYQLMEATLTARHAGLNEFISLQPHYSLGAPLHGTGPRSLCRKLIQRSRSRPRSWMRTNENNSSTRLIRRSFRRSPRWC